MGSRAKIGSTYGLLSLVIAATLLFLAPVQKADSAGAGSLPSSRNVIIFIGDGMGTEHVKAGGMFLKGEEGTLSFESFPAHALVATDNARGKTTDSAAAATAIATGRKVDNGVVSVALPGDGSPLETLLERFKSLGRSTGLVTTTFVTHATPAAFGAHRRAREDYAGIAEDYLSKTRPDVLFGGARSISPHSASSAGYTVVRDREEMKGLSGKAGLRVSGQFGGDHMPYELDGTGTLPHLSEMTASALDILDDDPEGFFLMVEGGRIDHASHANDAQRMVREVAEFSRAVEEAVEWAAGRSDTLIVVTADHETGGLEVVGTGGKGNAPEVRWGTREHTGKKVPLYAAGVNSGLFAGAMDNTDIHDLLLR